MDYRTRQPGALIRRAVQRAEAEGTDLQTVVREMLTRYVEDGLSAAASLGAKGGRASAASLTREERRAKAIRAATARWHP